MQLKKLLGSLVLSTSLLVTATAEAQPGTPLADTAVSADIKALFSLAADVAPAFKTGSGWFLYSGYTYKFFASSGIYAGVKDGNVYLLGGPYGSSLTPRMTLSAATSSLQALKNAQQNGPASDFGNIWPIKGINDLGMFFTELTMTHYSKSNLFPTALTTNLTLEAPTPNQYRLTITASNTPAVTTAEFTTDSNGNVTKFVMNGFEWPASQRQSLAVGLVSSMLLSLAGPETPMVKAAISKELQSPALTQKVKSRTLNGTSYSSLILEIADAPGTTNILTELTDMGSFTIATRYEANIPGALGSVTKFEISAAKLR